MHITEFSKISPSFGPIFHGNWPAGLVERNRRIYDFELIFFSKGTTKVIVPGEAFICHAGSAIIIPPNMVHCSVAQENVERWCIHFDWFSDCRGPRGIRDVFVFTDDSKEFHPELCASAPPSITFPYFASHAELTASLIHAYFQYSDPAGNPLIRRGLLLQILGILPDREFGSPKKCINRLVLNAKERIDAECLNFPFRITDIAKSMRITTSHLSRQFKAQIGCSITDYVMKRRLELAQGKLLATQSTVKEIADMCGFPSANYFCRFFRKMCNLSPDAWRKQAEQMPISIRD